MLPSARIRVVNDPNLVIIGSIGEGRPISSENVIKGLVDSLDSAVALKMEGDEQTIALCNPMSPEMLTKVAMSGKPVSYFPESDEHDIGYYLLKLGVPEELAELYVIGAHLTECRRKGVEPASFFASLPHETERYKKHRFSFINAERAIQNFLKVYQYCKISQLPPSVLMDFAYDFEGFMGKVREIQFWKPDLERFRKDYSGKIAVICGDYHTDFVKAVLDGSFHGDLPEWANHMNQTRSDRVYDSRISTGRPKIYRHITTALR